MQMPKNGTLTRIVESLIIAALVGGIAVYGNMRVIETKLDSFSSNLSRIDKTIEKIVDRLNMHIVGHP